MQETQLLCLENYQVYNNNYPSYTTQPSFLPSIIILGGSLRCGLFLFQGLDLFEFHCSEKLLLVENSAFYNQKSYKTCTCKKNKQIVTHEYNIR